MATLTRLSPAITLFATGLLCLSVLIAPVSSIKCFQCNSKVDPGCGNLTVGDVMSVHYKECDQFADYEGKDPFCRKTDVTIQKDEHRVVRGCGWKKYHLHCYNVEEASYAERVCQCYTDGCNPAAPTLPLSASLLIFVATSTLALRKAALWGSIFLG